MEHVMTQKTTLPWDLEHAMTAFQVDSRWYEKYWFASEDPPPLKSRLLARLAALFRAPPLRKPRSKPINALGLRNVFRRADGSINVDRYCQKWSA
jgi:hypothetical protein